MTEEEKDLLLKDLCARLPYGVKAIAKTHKGENVGKIISVSTKNNIILGELYNGKECFWLDYGCFKPYLRPMTSMNKEEKAIYTNYKIVVRGLGIVFEYNLDFVTEWLLKHHFDYRGLIEKGLAIEAPEGMYDTKTE